MKKPNIILITADSLRRDHLGCYSSTAAATPHIDSLAQRSKVHFNAYSTGPNTPHAFPGIMAGRNALASSKLGVFEDEWTVAEALKESGYTTLGFNAANPYISRHFRYHRGFDHFEDFVDFELLRTTSAGVNSGVIGIPQADLEQYLMSEDNLRRKEALERWFNETIARTLPEARPPFFLWVHYMDTHYPYVPSVDFQKMSGVTNITKDDNYQLNQIVRGNLLPSPGQLQEIKKLYSACVRQLDAQIGHLLTLLSATEGIGDANILFCADHGEEFMEHGDFQHRSKLFEELLQVPLIINGPRYHSSQPPKQRISLASIPEIIMNLAGEREIFRTTDDRDLDVNKIYSAASIAPNGNTPSDRNMLNINPLPKTLSLWQDHWKFIYRRNHGPLLFNLFRDPDEAGNVAGEEKTTVEEFSEIAAERLGELETRRLSKQASRIRERVIREDALRIS